MPKLKLATLVLVIVAASACGGESPTQPAGDRMNPSAQTSSSGGSRRSANSSSNSGPAKRIDPKRDGFEIGLGEWAITAEAQAIRPGPVTFVIQNRGTVPHGFEIELEGESSGHGSGDLFKAETELLQPGESTRMRVDLAPGVHKIECLVDGHDDMGMEDLLDVRANAPLVKDEAQSEPGRVAIADFAFAPEVTEVEAGTQVRWDNDDPVEHTVTAINGDFESNNLAEGESFSLTFDEPGSFAYRCVIHPEMEGTVNVR
ncbi:MAG: cupredoxin domain-containing protein [Actinomycetota bacterium]